MTSQLNEDTAKDILPVSKFLSEQIAIYRSQSETVKYHLFVGNEAADADSIVSALATAHLTYLNDRQTDAYLHKAYLPLVSVPKEEYPLRKEVETLLNFAGVKMSDILSLHDLTLPPTLLHPIDITLVDHNTPTPLFSSKLLYYPHEVVQIFDHHKDLGGFGHLPAYRRVIAFDSTLNKATAASTCTLIFEAFSACKIVLSHDVALLLCGVILLDSLNLDPKACKATDRDHIAVNSLNQLLSAGYLLNYTFSTPLSLFSTLNEIKTDRSYWLSLSTQNILKYDYKLFTASQGDHTVRIGMSSVMLPVADLLTREGCMDIMSVFMRTHQLYVLVLMTIYSVGAATDAKSELVREIALLGSDSSRVQSLYAHLHAYSGGDLHLTSLAHIPGSDKELVVMAARQGNIKASRKQIAPIVVDYFETNK